MLWEQKEMKERDKTGLVHVRNYAVNYVLGIDGGSSQYWSIQ